MERNGEGRTLLHLALSLLVDGDRVREALVVADAGQRFCYPCLSDHLELMDALGSRVLKLYKGGMLRPLEDFVSVRLRSTVLLALCLRRGRVLVLQLNPLVPEEVAAREVYSCLLKLASPEKEGEEDEDASGEPMRCGGRVESVYKYFAEEVVSSGAARAAALASLATGARYCHPRPLKLPEGAFEELVEFVEELFVAGTGVRALRASIRGTHVVLVRVDELHLLALEVEPSTPTKHVLRAVSLREPE